MELLIVIAIIGILVVGILVALDPVEQTRKASDSNTLRTANEVKGATNRYYVARSCWPWQTLGGGTCGNASGCTNGSGYVLGASGCGQTVSDNLVNSGELKSYSATNINIVPNVGTGTSWYVAFTPTSKSVALNSVTKYANITTTACSTTAAIPSSAVGTSCNYCLSQ